jgi:hypothetical protein
VIVDYRGNIEARVAPELPTRLAMELAGLRLGMDSIGVEHEAALKATRSAALGCIPAGRRAVLDLLYEKADMVPGTDIIRKLGNSAKRSLLELHEHGLVRFEAQAGKSHLWGLTTATRESLKCVMSLPTPRVRFSPGGSRASDVTSAPGVRFSPGGSGMSDTTSAPGVRVSPGGSDPQGENRIPASEGDSAHNGGGPPQAVRDYVSEWEAGA